LPVWLFLHSNASMFFLAYVVLCMFVRVRLHHLHYQLPTAEKRHWFNGTIQQFYLILNYFWCIFLTISWPEHEVGIRGDKTDIQSMIAML
jgi:hypothetical protein